MASKYKDPATVTCPECAARSSRRVADLLALQATCPNCGSSLTQVGLSMRRGLDEWATFVATIVMSFRLEERLGTKFDENEIYGVKTLRDLASIVGTRLDQKGDVASRSIELTRWAVSELASDPLWRSHRSLLGEAPDPLDVDAPLLDVLDPGRWNRP
jgi:hypothetical protein